MVSISASDPILENEHPVGSLSIANLYVSSVVDSSPVDTSPDPWHKGFLGNRSSSETNARRSQGDAGIWGQEAAEKLNGINHQNRISNHRISW